MGGLWKLAAMSAVIGAGLVVVWQAQQGLNSSSANAPVEPDALSDDAQSTDVALATPDDLTTSAPVNDPFAGFNLMGQSAPVAPKKNPPAVAAADTLDQRSEPSAAGPLLAAPSADTNPAPVRYQRGLDFKQHGGLEESSPSVADSTAEASVVENDPFSRSPTPLPLPVDDELVRTADAAASEQDAALAVTPASAQQDEPTSPAPDPLFGNAPPDFDAKPALPKPSSSTRQKSAPSSASSREEPLPNPKSDDFDPFTNDVPPRKASTPAEPVLELGPPAEDVRDRVPQRLPTDLDATPDLDVRRSRSTRSTDAPSATETQESTSARDPKPSRLQLLNDDGTANTTSIQAPATVEDSLIGDGQITAGTPRGVQEPRLTIEKVAPAKAVLGQELVYSVIVKNIGGSPASQVIVEDRIPKGARLVGTSPRAELTEKRLIWKLGTLKPNDHRKISVKVIPEEEGSLGSVAKVNFVSEVAAEIVITAPQLKLRVSAPSAVKMGEKAEVLFTITNTGNGDAKNVMLRSVLPEGLQHPSGSDLEYFVGDLAPKYSREVPLELVAVKPGRVMQRASVTGNGNLNAEAETSIEILGEQLVLTRRGQAKVFVGRPTVYANTVGNEGTRAVPRVKVSEIVPTGFEFVEATNQGHFDPDSRTITWTVGPVAPGAEETVSATLMPKSVGQYDDSVTAMGPTGSVATVKQSIAVEGFPSLAIEPMEEQRLLAVGEQMTSKIQLRNRGSAAAGNVGLTIMVPEELRVISAKGPSTHQVVGQRLVFDPVAALSPKDIASYEIVLEGVAPGDSRLELQIAADHLRRPVKHEEAVQIVGEEK